MKFYLLRQEIKNALGKEVKTFICEVYHALERPLPRALENFYADEVVYGKIYPKAHERYAPQTYKGRTVYLKSEDARERVVGWHELIPDGLEIREVPGNHLSMLVEPYVRELAETLEQCLSKAQSGLNADEHALVRTRDREQASPSGALQRNRMVFG